MLLNRISLLLDLECSPLQICSIVRLVQLLVVTGDQEWCVCKQVVHLFERQSCGLREEEVEGYCVGEIADDEQVVVLETDVCHCDTY